MHDEPPVVPALVNEARWHALLFAGATAIVCASVLLQLSDQGRVVLPWVELSLPELCYWKRYFGTNCPGCGLTRSFVALGHGEWSAAWRFNSAGWLLFAAVVFQLPYRSVQWWATSQGRQARPWPGLSWAAWALLPILLGQWIVRSWG